MSTANQSILFETGPLYEVNNSCSTKISVNQGGTSSGKTYTILQVLFAIAISDPGCVITVVGQDIPNLKKGAMRDAHTIVSKSPVLQKLIKSYNKSDRIYELYNAAIIEFTSYSDEQDAKSGKRDYLFMNEANGIAYPIYWQLAIRTRKRIFIDYNPTAKFWVHDKLIGQPNVSLFISDHRDNPFLSDELHAEIESIDDKELFKVYARGLTGQVKGLIYPNYKLCDGIPAFIDTNYGLDFGYNHKMALIETGKWDRRMYWNEVIYQSELTISGLIHLMQEMGISRSKKIYADHANPDKIQDLKNAGYNVLSAEKDVKNGIDYVKGHQLYITEWSKGLIREANQYKWKETKDGTVLDEPVKFMDDGMDGGRYGSYSHRNHSGLVVSTSRERDIFEDL